MCVCVWVCERERESAGKGEGETGRSARDRKRMVWFSGAGMMRRDAVGSVERSSSAWIFNDLRPQPGPETLSLPPPHPLFSTPHPSGSPPPTLP